MRDIMESNKVAVVTGASQGIGKAVAIALAKDAYHVILLSRNLEALSKVQKTIGENGGKATAIALDVSESDKVKEVIEDVIKQFGRIDVLFNNVGILYAGTIDLPDEDMRRLVEVDLLGAMYVAKYVGLQMKSQKSGYIMNLSSMLGQRGLVLVLAVIALLNSVLLVLISPFFRELIGLGVKVTSICPSFVSTRMLDHLDFLREKMIKKDDIVKTVRFLLDLSENAVIANINIECPAAVIDYNL